MTRQPAQAQLLFPEEELHLNQKRRIFLEKLRSNSRGGIKYKRYLGAPIRYPGGKSFAVG